MPDHRTDSIDLDRAIYDPEYRRTVTDALKAQRHAPAPDLSTPSASGDPDAVGMTRR